MAAEDENEDFDTEIGGGKGEKGDADDKGRGRTRDSGDDEDDLEDLSREELYDRLKDANNTAKKFRLRLKRARGGDRVSSRDSRRESRRDDDRDDRDDRDDNRGRGRDDRGRDSGRDARREDRNRDRDDDRDSRESEERAIRAEAKVALANAGIPANRLKRAVQLINTRNLEFDSDDELIGIEDEIDDLKDEWPELFEKRRSRDDDDEDDDRGTRRRRIPRADVRSGGGRGSRDRKEKTATEIQAESLSAWAAK